MGKEDAAIALGDVVAGRYRIDSILGEGGYGVVFRATQLPIGRPVALKMLLVEALAHADGRARFRREAELAQRLEHPNTVRLYDFGETEAGLPFIAWELLRGRALSDVLAAEGPLAPPRVAKIAAQVLKSLVEAHALGIVHRDVKPSNVFLCDIVGETDFVKVLDFGIAKNLLAWGTGLTPEGSVLGTPAYMAPEQVRGDPLSPAADLYALGLVMAEMLTGQPVFLGALPLDVLMAHLSDGPPPFSPEVLASPLGAVITRAAEKRLDARFATASEMLEQVEAVVASSRREPGAAPASRAPSLPASPAAFVAPPDVFAVTLRAEIPLPATDAASASAVVVSAGLGAAETARVSALAPTAVALPQAAAITGSLAPAAPPPRAIVPDVPPAAGPVSPPWRRTAAVAATAGFVAAAVLVIILLATGVIGALRPGSLKAASGIPSPGNPSFGSPGPYLVTGKRFAHLTAKQIRERIEKANHRVLAAEDRDGTSVWVLSGTDRRVVRFCFGDPRSAEAAEVRLSRDVGATARDGNCVINLHMATAEAHPLLDQIAR